MDKLTPARRSAVMKRVRGKRTAPENRLAQALKDAGLHGFRRNDRRLPGTPDFAFWMERVAVLVHGCFWHGCRKHYRAPASSFKHPPGFWAEKLRRNQGRDRKVRAALRLQGWTVVTIWEHEPARDAARRVKRRLRPPLPRAEANP